MRKFKNVLIASLCISFACLGLISAAIFNGLNNLMCSRLVLVSDSSLMLAGFLDGFINFWDIIIKYRLWIIIGICAIIFIVLLIVIIRACKLHKAKKRESLEAKKPAESKMENEASLNDPEQINEEIVKPAEVAEIEQPIEAEVVENQDNLADVDTLEVQGETLQPSLDEYVQENVADEEPELETPTEAIEAEETAPIEANLMENELLSEENVAEEDMLSEDLANEEFGSDEDFVAENAAFTEDNATEEWEEPDEPVTPYYSQNLNENVPTLNLEDYAVENMEKAEYDDSSEVEDPYFELPYEEAEDLQNSNVQSKNQALNNQLSDDLLLKFIFNTEQDIKDIKQKLEFQEKPESVLKQEEKPAINPEHKQLCDRLDRIEKYLNKQIEEKNKTAEEAKQNAKFNSVFKELSLRLDKTEELIKQEREEKLKLEEDKKFEQQIKSICNEFNERLNLAEERLNRKNVDLVKTDVDERQDAEIQSICKQLSDRIDKTEALINSKTEENKKPNVETNQNDSLLLICKALNDKLDKVEDYIKEHKETSFKKEIEQQQKELEKVKQDMLAEKIAEKLKAQEKSVFTEELLNKLMVREEPKAQLAAKNDIANVKITEKEETKDYSKEPVAIAADKPKQNEDLASNDYDALDSNDANSIDDVQKYSLQEAYRQLSDKQKKYFDMLKIYAQSKPNARVKKTKSYLNIGVGNRLYIKLAIKKNTVVAYFTVESEELLMLRLSEKGSIKPEQTKIKIVDMSAYETATKMIDIRVEQVARELEIVQELRREKQKQRYEDSKRSKK